MKNYVKAIIPMHMGDIGFKYLKKDMKVFSYLIYTEHEVFLYDTGLNPLFVKEREKILQDLELFIKVEVNRGQLLEERLKEYGLKPQDISGVICSHLHFDHAGGLKNFNNSQIEIYLGAGEYVEACNTKRSFEYKKEDFAFLKDAKNVVCIETVFRIHENENVKIIPTPGHSAGHISLLLTGISKKALLTGDAVYTFDNLVQNKLSSYPYKKQMAKESLMLLHKLAKECDYIICGHDCDTFAGQKIIL